MLLHNYEYEDVLPHLISSVLLLFSIQNIIYFVHLINKNIVLLYINGNS